MKKVLLTVLASVGIALLVPFAASADASPGITDVSGAVTNNGNPVNGASVQVNCNGNTLYDTSDFTGTYVVDFTSGECPAGSIVTATATHGGESGTNTGDANPLTTRLNVAIINISIVPELGMITAGGAAILGGGAFLIVRKRQLEN